MRLLGEVLFRRGKTGNAIDTLNEAIRILEEVGNCRQLWQAHASLASVLDHIGRIREAREQWGTAAGIIRSVAEGLSDRELREGFLRAEPIREILSKVSA